MDFDDMDTTQPQVELRIVAGAKQDTVAVTLRVLDGTKLRLEKTAHAVDKSRIEALASWIKDVWDGRAPYVLEELGFELRFSHREHVGEIYYDVLVDGRRVRSVYEQGGLSNDHRAQLVRAELARTGS